MAKGELFLRTSVTRNLGSDAVGLVTEAPAHWGEIASAVGMTNDRKGWVDAYERYGMSLEPGARGSIITPAPKKDPDGQNTSTAHGVAYSGTEIGKTDERAVSVDMHIVAGSSDEFLRRYDLFCAEILDPCYMQMRLSLPVGNKVVDRGVYHFLYRDCQNFKEFCLGMAKYTLSLKEPHPEIRDERVPNVML